MDIEELNKFQIVLLVLLVSFVTSIATGIVTVTLLAQAPPAVTQTINHVVERTVQVVSPDTASSTKSAPVQTVIVKEEDLVTGSIVSALSRTGRVYSGTASTSAVVALAAEIAPGILVTDSAISGKDHLVTIGKTSAIFSVSQAYPDIGVAILTPASTTPGLSDSYKIADTGSVKLGSTVTAILGVTNERVAIGAVSSLFGLGDIAKKGGPTIHIRAVDTNLSAGAIAGAPLINVFGDLVGVSTGAAQTAGGGGAFVSASDIVALLASKASTTPSH